MSHTSNPQDWQELGDEESQETYHHPHGGEEHHHHYEGQPCEGEEDVAPQQPDGQWAELGDEEPQEHHHEHHLHGGHPRESQDDEEGVAPMPAQQADQWAELGDEEPQEQPHHHGEHAHAPVETAYEAEPQQHTRSMPPPQAARQHLGAIVKPKTRNVKAVSRWEPVEHQPREESDDEFEMSTCMAPVYEGEGDAGNEDASVFKNGEPDCKGEIMSCFDEPNLLYRIIDPNEKTWAFYNDSLNYEMHVQFTFGKHSKLQPLENTVMNQNDEGQYVTEVVVYPTETEMFVKGSVNGFTSKLRAVPLSDEYHNARRGITEEQVASETAAIQRLTDSDNAEDVLQACMENGIAFVDPEFPPCQASLDAGATKPFKPLAWARPQSCVPEEMAAQVRLFRTSVQPGCVDAGDLGDSWVMCAVAAVSEDPARLMGMFRHPEGKAAAQREHAVGAYRVTFNKNGWWRSVLVDSYLPVSAGKLKYAKSAVDPAEMWPAILEKAYAKLHGSYAKICSGDPLHALQDMTGFSTTRFDDALVDESSKTKAELFDDLARGIAAGYTVICNTPGKGPNDKNRELTEELAKVGLVTGHAYTILDAKHIEKENLRLVKVRNAWGRGLEWNGDWSDDDSKWEEYPDVADACAFQKAADGTFWMSWEAAQKYFNGGGVCFSHQPAYDYRMNSVFTNGVPSAVLEIEVSSPTWFTFVISQDDKRCRDTAAEYQPVMISIAEPVEGGMYKVVLNTSADGVHPTPDKWTFLQARDISLIRKLDVGKYIVVPRNMPSDADPVPYVLGMITNKEVGGGDVSVKFKRLDASNRVFENFPKFEPELKEVEQPVQFQRRAPGEGFPLTQMGEELA
ncbi:putative calpain-like cysteine peptidase putativecysteine peptidase Clan CA family C2 [Leptomonas pyrrhocoris]|uniref:Putative calpain-like cysteine peptidase putativecysteine peptidase Clan CA family C2 n=1 Tax=Leptomonas pyrrhocoris TaxID=157538 RepID=A0A0M9FSW0_LEPPY|nr:putative calpain-like cysteine peptidase putativecysteine peptidase Clan CA family C2 [Leptomonas pyrrhocoris]KPA75259.1 putative calpain-like cysteine peptidase putativecysteine peptidase Clan CA family C2 [Leptomonas pyrrhocoris]|eukprot:XP_015653698.1 putative calpain-like cysteine peptidase putativecysteine peptidase Clan CA family C2 [Leptomonas pyrrhocoris]